MVNTHPLVVKQQKDYDHRFVAKIHFWHDSVNWGLGGANDVESVVGSKRSVKLTKESPPFDIHTGLGLQRMRKQERWVRAGVSLKLISKLSSFFFCR